MYSPVHVSSFLQSTLKEEKIHRGDTDQAVSAAQRYDGLYLRFLGRAHSGLSTSSATARRRPADNRVIGYSSRPRDCERVGLVAGARSLARPPSTPCFLPLFRPRTAASCRPVMHDIPRDRKGKGKVNGV